MCSLISRPPKRYQGDNGYSRTVAYCFGRKYATKDYVRVGTVFDNEQGHIGFVLLDGLEKDKHPDRMRKYVSSLLGTVATWEDRDLLARVQKECPYVLFLGNVLCVDESTYLYAHRDAAGVVDSLIVDNDYFHHRV